MSLDPIDSDRKTGLTTDEHRELVEVRRRILDWSLSDRITAEIVVDALEIARWRRRPESGTVVDADRGAQYTSWLFGHLP